MRYKDIVLSENLKQEELLGQLAEWIIPAAPRPDANREDSNRCSGLASFREAWGRREPVWHWPVKSATRLGRQVAMVVAIGTGAIHSVLAVRVVSSSPDGQPAF